MSHYEDPNLFEGDNGLIPILDRDDSFVNNLDGNESCKTLGIESNDDTEYEDYDENNIFNRPIIVGYAFGPKKMNTMGVVMAEASKTKLSTISTTTSLSGTEESSVEVVLPTYMSQNDAAREILRKDFALPLHTKQSDDEMENEEDDYREIDGYPTSPTLNRYNGRSKKRLHEHESITFTIDGHMMKSSEENLHNNLRNIVRYFRSSCSSVGSNDFSETTGTYTATSVASSSQYTGTTLDLSLSCTGRSMGIKNSVTSQGSSKHVPIRISFVPLDPDFPLEEQHGGKLDVILHKLTEDILCLSQLAMTNAGLKEKLKENRVQEIDYVNAELYDEDSQALDRVFRISNYNNLNPRCCLVDDPSKVLTLMSRADIADTLHSCLKGITSKSGISVGSPAYAVIAKPFTIAESEITASTININDNSFIDSLWLHRKVSALSYPIIVKPLTAAGTKASHAMAVVLHPSSLHKIASEKAPCLLQEYSNHDAALYKVYVLGEHVSVHKRRSLPNLPSDASVLCRYHHVEFDSQRPYPRLSDFGYPETDVSIQPDQAKMPLDWDKNIVTVDEIMPIVNALKIAFGLELFGFDVLITRENTIVENDDSAVRNDSVPDEMEQNTNQRMLVIDVNYFPSYKEVTNFPALLAKYLTDRVLRSRRKS